MVGQLWTQLDWNCRLQKRTFKWHGQMIVLLFAWLTELLDKTFGLVKSSTLDLQNKHWSLQVPKVNFKVRELHENGFLHWSSWQIQCKSMLQRLKNISAKDRWLATGGFSKFPRIFFPTSKRGSLLHSAILFPPLSLSNLSKIISNGSKLYLQWD